LVQRLLQLAYGESGGASACDKFSGELGNLTVAFSGWNLDLPVGHEGPGALLGVENSA
jgi:hypothetical protein